MSQPSDMPPIYLHPHAAANEPVTLHEGPIAIQGGMTGTGRLALHWQPSTGLRLEADMDSMNAPQPGARLTVDVAGSTAEVLFSSLRIGMGAAGHFARVSGSVSRFTKGTPTGLEGHRLSGCELQRLLHTRRAPVTRLRHSPARRRASARKLAHPPLGRAGIQRGLQKRQ